MSEENTVYCDQDDVEKNKVMALLAYISILFLVPLLTAKNSRFARYHTNQGVIFFLACVFLFMLSNIVGSFAYNIPVIGFVLYPINYLICYGFMFLGMLYGVVNSIVGRCKPLPLIGNLFVVVKYDLPSKEEGQ